MAKERPILFSGAMVRALLDGTKTQTRRVVKPQPYLSQPRGPLALAHRNGDFVWPHPKVKQVCTISNKPGGPDGWAQEHSPYGQPGDRLWVREAFMHEPADYCWEASVSIPCRPAVTTYRADFDGDSKGAGWKPSIHMPRHLSRINLEITGVRVERLQDISEADCIAEGCTTNHNGYFRGGPHSVSGLKQMATAKQAYRDLWQNINGADSWAANPWVWVVEFKRVAQAADSATVAE